MTEIIFPAMCDFARAGFDITGAPGFLCSVPECIYIARGREIDTDKIYCPVCKKLTPLPEA